MMILNAQAVAWAFFFALPQITAKASPAHMNACVRNINRRIKASLINTSTGRFWRMPYAKAI